MDVSCVLSVIIPTWNELANPYLMETLDQLEQVDAALIEIIIVDSNSDDGWIDLVAKKKVIIYFTDKTNRAARLNIGVSYAESSMLLLHHPRSLLTKGCIEELLTVAALAQPADWGGFTLQHDYDHFFLKFISWYSNSIRFKKKGIVYLDHCIFTHAQLAEKVFPIENVAIFEDTNLSKALFRYSQPMLLSSKVITSSVRFQKRGVFRHFFMNQCLKFMFSLGFSDTFMNYIYERYCHLNMPLIDKALSPKKKNKDNIS